MQSCFRRTPTNNPTVPLCPHPPPPLPVPLPPVQAAGCVLSSPTQVKVHSRGASQGPSFLNLCLHFFDLLLRSWREAF